MASSSSAAVANLLKIKGRSYSLSSACATSAHNIGHAYELIRAGVLNRAIAGGGEDTAELIAAAFQGLRLALSTHYNDTPTEASRPFDANRDGFVISGGGGIVVLEDLDEAVARGARIRAEVLGYAANSDGFDLVLPEPEGAQAGACMRAAISDAGIEPTAIDYVNTHGTSTIHGDIAEVKAIRTTFGDRVPPFSSTKSMTGHGIGAAGALELIFCIGMMEQGFIAPSINIDTPDPAVEGLPVVTETRHQALTTVLSNNFGFGGTNASLVIRRFDG
jgi:3-oxoacyl-[acyl-carrier-protein] synthase-1